MSLSELQSREALTEFRVQTYLLGLGVQGGFLRSLRAVFGVSQNVEAALESSL